MSFVSVISTLFRSPGLWDKFDIDFILGKRDQSSKFIDQFRYLGIEVLPHEFLIENTSVNVEFLENNTREITAGTYLLSTVEIVNSVKQLGLVRSTYC